MGAKTLYQTIVSHASAAGTLHAAQPAEATLYQKLLDAGFTKQELDALIHKLTLLRLADEKKSTQLSFNGKLHRYVQNNSQQATRFLQRLTSKGLMLLKTQWAKKPRNPI